MFFLIATFVLQLPAPKLIGTAETMQAGKLKAYIVEDDSSVTLEIQGPTALVFEVRTDGEVPQTVKLTVERDQRYKSESDLTLKASPKSPLKAMPLGAKVGYEVPAGAHRYNLRGPGKRIAIIPQLMKHLPASLPGTRETDSGEPGAVAPANEGAPTP